MPRSHLLKRGQYKVTCTMHRAPKFLENVSKVVNYHSNQKYFSFASRLENIMSWFFKYSKSFLHILRNVGLVCVRKNHHRFLWNIRNVVFVVWKTFGTRVTFINETKHPGRLKSTFLPLTVPPSGQSMNFLALLTLRGYSPVCEKIFTWPEKKLRWILHT